MEVPHKIKTLELPCDPAIQLLGIYQEKHKGTVEGGIIWANIGEQNRRIHFELNKGYSKSQIAILFSYIFSSQ